MSPGSVYSGVAGPEYINFRTFGNTRPTVLRRSDAGTRSGLRRRRHCALSAHVLDEHLRAEAVRFLHVLVMVTLTRVANLPKLLVAELPARLTERLERVLGLTRHDDVLHEAQEVTFARDVGEVLGDAKRLPEHLLSNTGLRAQLLLILLEHPLMLTHHRDVPAAQVAEACILGLALMVHQGLEKGLMLHHRVVDLAAQEIHAFVHCVYLRVDRAVVQASCCLRLLERPNARHKVVGLAKT